MFRIPEWLLVGVLFLLLGVPGGDVGKGGGIKVGYALDATMEERGFAKVTRGKYNQETKKICDLNMKLYPFARDF